MRHRLSLFRLGLLAGLTLLSATCATPREQSPSAAERPSQAGASFVRDDGAPAAGSPRLLREAPTDGRAPGGADSQPRPLPIGLRELEDESVKVFLPARPLPPAFDLMSIEEALSLSEALAAVRVPPTPRLHLVESPGPRRSARPATAQAGLQLREEFLAGFGPGLLPLPETLDDSPLLAALKMSPRFMGEGFRQAAEELFNSPLFIHSVYFSVLVYFSAWLAPEPFFSKAFAAALTVRLSLLVGVVELSRVAQACMRLYQEVEAARTLGDLEAASARFGTALGGTGFRVVVLVATMGLGRLLPAGPEGGIGSSLSARRRASPFPPPVPAWGCVPWRAPPLTAPRPCQPAMGRRTLGATRLTMRPSKANSPPGKWLDMPGSTRTGRRRMPRADASSIPSQ
jgi:hypothetical protein